jgi:hypothetical protein
MEGPLDRHRRAFFIRHSQSAQQTFQKRQGVIADCPIMRGVAELADMVDR